MNAHQRFAYEQVIGATWRMALVYFRCADVVQVYPNDGRHDPQHDEHILLELVEGARDAWRPIWRGGSNYPLEPPEEFESR